MSISDRWSLVKRPLFAKRNAAIVVGVKTVDAKTTFQRARQPAQKAQRRAHLLGTARAALAEGVALREFSLNELARRAGMAKANVYTYFESREALLLALLSDEWARWFARLPAASRAARPRTLTLDEVVTLLAGSLARAPLLCELTAALPTVIEQNLSEEAIRAFKREVLTLFAQIAAYLAQRAPALSASAYGELVYDAAQAIVGLFPGTHPAPAVARALTDPELRFFRRDFASELTRVLGALAADHAHRAVPSAPLSPTGSATRSPTVRAAGNRVVRRRDADEAPRPEKTRARTAARADDVTAYIDAAKEPARSRLRTLREVIGAAAPHAVERLAYGLATWHQGENLIHLGAFTHHVGVYPGPAAIRAFAEDLAPFTTSKGAIRLPHDAPLPTELVRRITRWRIEQATQRAGDDPPPPKKQRKQPRRPRADR